MPRVSQLHREQRRAQIVTAARHCFRRRGFHGTSMQDLFAEAGMSSGAFYLHFGSKDELIIAIAEDNMADVIAMMRAAAQQNLDEDGASIVTLGELLARVIPFLARRTAQEDLTEMAVQVWAEAMVNPVVADGMVGLVAHLHAEVVDLMTASGANSGSEQATARVVVSTLSGLVLQRALLGPGVFELVPDSLRAAFPQVLLPIAVERFAAGEAEPHPELTSTTGKPGATDHGS